ncbi:kinase-like protein [Hypoxylon trugodes]|uniref:kinase-like protein n=1 Tax=Hypoxylon trugodes TaxID=326681 RepID=UPI0021939B05|nr:kinase-like protein [Hypoxylon trugodes]KAI1385243.1 kinase-like protein [Hypoxylon trugodes]
MQLESLDTDPFERVDKAPLGKANSEVWKVKHKGNGEVYARKEFSLRVPNRDQRVKDVKKEISIMDKLKHRHIVQIHGSHYIGSDGMIGILLRPIADMSLTGWFDYMGELQRDGNDTDRLEARNVMCQWPSCLFHALDYLHNLGIRHKDIKPSNILIKDDHVYLADFGISRNFRDATTSKTKGPLGGMTERYISPEANDELPRGRAADVWALGCTVLEICTVASGQSTIQDLNQHLLRNEKGLPPPFCQSPYLVFDWIWLLLVSLVGEPPLKQHIQKMLQLAFLMLDPNPGERITARQLLDLLNQLGQGSFHSIAELYCDGCKRKSCVPMHNTQPHSVFKKSEDEDVYIPSRLDLSAETPNLWEEIKQRWLVRDDD